MRKILTGVLGVTGLLAVVLAVSASPATAQELVRFSTDTDPGTYTVSWKTAGGCDPSTAQIQIQRSAPTVGPVRLPGSVNAPSAMQR